MDWSLRKRLSVTSNMGWIWPHVARGHPHAAYCCAGGVSPLQLCREGAAPRLLRLPPDDQVSFLVSWLNKVNRRYHLELSHTLAACNRELSVLGATWDGAMALLPLVVIRGQTLCQLGFISGYAVSFSSLSLFLRPSLLSFHPPFLPFSFNQRSDPEALWSPWLGCAGYGGNILRKHTGACLWVWRCTEACRFPSNSAVDSRCRQLSVSEKCGHLDGVPFLLPPSAGWGAFSELRTHYGCWDIRAGAAVAPQMLLGSFRGRLTLHTSRLLVSVHLKRKHRILEPSEAFPPVESQQKPAPCSCTALQGPCARHVNSFLPPFVISASTPWEVTRKSFPRWAQFYLVLSSFCITPTPMLPPSPFIWAFLFPNPTSSDLVMRSITGCGSWLPS